MFLKTFHIKNLILLFLAFGVLISCSKDDGILNDRLVGVWYRVNDYADTDRSNTTEWIFTENGTLEILSIEFTKSTGEFLGYSLLSIGKYDYRNDILSVSKMVGYSYQFDGEVYLEDADYYPNKESFFERKGIDQKFNSASLSFRKGNQELFLTFLECNDTGNCIGFETLTRK